MVRIAVYGARSVFFQPLRLFSATPASFFAASSAVFAAKKASSNKQLSGAQKALDADKKKLKKLQALLKKEKDSLKSVQTKIKTQEKKHLETIKKAEDAVLKKATKPVRRIGAYTYFVKTFCSKDAGLKEAAARWAQLSSDEKVQYEDGAKTYNDEKLKSFQPKPKAPASNYAQFVKANYPAGVSSVTEAQRKLSSEWHNLPDEEKAKYAPSESEWSTYKKRLQEWKTERVRLYHEAEKQKAAA